METNMSLQWIKKRDSGLSKVFCMVSSRAMSGDIKTLEYWHTSSVSVRLQKFKILRVQEHEIRHWLNRLGQVQIDFRVPLVQLGYVIKNPTEFETGAPVVLPDDVRKWSIDMAKSLVAEQNRKPPEQLNLKLGPA